MLNAEHNVKRTIDYFLEPIELQEKDRLSYQDYCFGK